MSTERAALLAGIALFLSAPLTFAQRSDQPTLTSLNLSCSDFHHNQNGMWSPVHPIQITSPNGIVKLGPGASFGKGNAMGGVRLGAVLNKECLSHP
jgi:hypothetical protein